MPSRVLCPDDALRKNNFDFLRFALASLVMLAHSELMYARRTALGTFSVHGFFAISGFLVTQSWLRSPSAVDYLKKRFLRIYPAFLVVYFLDLFVVGPLGSDSPTGYFGRLKLPRVVAGIAALRQYTPAGVFTHAPLPHNMNVSMWTLRYELGCYALVIVLGALSVYRRRAGVLILFLAASLLSGWQARYASPIALPVYFLAGMCVYLYRDRLKASWVLVGTAVLGVVLARALPTPFQVVLPACIAYLLFFAAFCPQVRLENWGRRGDFSYGLYLYAFPVQQLLFQRWGYALTIPTLFLTAMAICLPCAVASWYLIERPCLRWARRSDLVLPHAGEAVVASEPEVRRSRT